MDDFNDINIESGSLGPDPSPQPNRSMGMFGMVFGKMTSDMKFVGLFTIIYGGLTCLSIIGAVIGIPLIIAGLRIREAADEYNFFRTTNDSKALRRAFEKQQKYFNILKILIIVGLVLFVLYIIAIMIFGIFAFSSMGSYDSF